MSWLKLDDGWRRCEKLMRATYEVGADAKWLWVEALSECAEARTDGFLPVYRLAAVAQAAGIRSAKRRDTVVAALVAAGKFHDHQTISGCARCSDALKLIGRIMEPGDVYAHDFLEYNHAKADQVTPEAKLKENRRRALNRDVELRQRIYERDRGLCRYCGIRVTQRRNDNRSSSRLQYDHVDPGCFDPCMGNTDDNVVLACAGCNRAKADRTPAEARMALLAPGTTAADTATEPEQNETNRTEIERDRAGSLRGTGPGRNAVGTRSERGRAGSKRAGPGRSGSGRSGSGAPTTPKARPP